MRFPDLAVGVPDIGAGEGDENFNGNRWGSTKIHKKCILRLHQRLYSFTAPHHIEFEIREGEAWA